MHNVNSKFKTFVRKFENSQKYFILDVYFDNAFNSIYFLPLYTVNKINEASTSLFHEHVTFASCSNRRKEFIDNFFVLLSIVVTEIKLMAFVTILKKTYNRRSQYLQNLWMRIQQ